MHNLASLLVKRDQHDEAQELYQRCLELERETQGAEQPDTLTCMNLGSSELIMLFPFLKMCAAMICLKPPRCEKLASFCHFGWGLYSWFKVRGDIRLLQGSLVILSSSPRPSSAKDQPGRPVAEAGEAP